MSTHNIGVYEALTKIIFQLSSNMIKYTTYLFFWASIMSDQSLPCLLEENLGSLAV